MKFPKFVIASDGHRTGLLLDDVFFGKGIERLDFSTENKDGEMKSTIRIMDLDVNLVSLERGEEKFTEFLEGTAETGKTEKILDGFAGKN